MNVLIFGFGFLGKPLAERLSEQGVNVRAIKRQLTSDDICLPIPIDTVALTPTVFLPHWANYETWVILLPPYQVPDYADVIQSLTHKACQFGIKHVVFGSSISVYGDSVRECNESTPTHAQTPSAQAIVAAETHLQHSALVHVDIMRLGGLYSAARHPIYTLNQRQNNTGAHQVVNVLHQDCAVRALMYVIMHPNGKRIRNVVEPQHPTKIQFYTQEANKLGVNVPHFDLNDTHSGKTVVSLFQDLPLS